VKKYIISFVLALVVVVLVLVVIVLASNMTARATPGTSETWIATRLRSLAMPRDERRQVNPFAANESILKEAREHFADHCASCHANDGSGDTALGRNLSPRAPDMRLAATQSKSDGELYYVIHNGIRFSGMPAWGAEGKDDDSWKLVLFIRHLPQLTTDEIKEMQKYNPKSDAERTEEQEEEDFLQGKPVGPSSAERSHQH